MTRILVVGPDDEQVSWWQTALHRPVEYSRSLAAANLGDADVVLLDLARVGSDIEFDDELAASAVNEAAARNPDAFWLLISPPAIHVNSFKLVKLLEKTLCGRADASTIAVEAHAVDDELDDLSAWLKELDRLDALDIDMSATDLSSQEQRCVRRLLRDVDSAELSLLSDGQGKARTFRVECRVGGAPAPLRVVKVGPAKTIDTEYRNFMQYVRLRLGDHRHPTLDSSGLWKAGAAGALMYTFIVGHPQALAEFMATGDRSGTVTDLYSTVLAPWLEGATIKKQQLSAFIDEFLEDVTLEEADELWLASNADGDPESPIPWLRDISSRDIEIEFPTAIAHGDLHGYNVLIDDAAKPWLIDFYHTQVRSALFDFAYAEAALLLHRPVGRDHAVNCTLEALQAAERAGEPVRAELGVIRRVSRERWGATSEGPYELARCCSALRRLRFGPTDKPRAKWVAHFAAAVARTLNPDWEEAPKRAPIAF